MTSEEIPVWQIEFWSCPNVTLPSSSSLYPSFVRERTEGRSVNLEGGVGGFWLMIIWRCGGHAICPSGWDSVNWSAKIWGGGGLLQLLQLCVMKIGYEKLPRNEWVTISQTRLVAWSWRRAKSKLIVDFESKHISRALKIISIKNDVLTGSNQRDNSFCSLKTAFWLMSGVEMPLVWWQSGVPVGMCMWGCVQNKFWQPP